MHRGGSHGPSGHGWHRNPTGFGKEKGQHPTGFGWQNLSKHIDNLGFHKYWSFQTKHKVFMITLTGDGGAVRVCERTRHFGFEVSVTIDGVAWIIDTLQEIQGKKSLLMSDLKRSFRNSTASYFLECFSNRKGEFLKLSVLRNNKIKAVIIPEEESARGWSDFMRCLNGVMGRKSESQHVIPRQFVKEKVVRNATNKQTWANVVKNSMKNAPKHDHRSRDCKEIEQGNFEGNRATVKHPSRKLKGLGSWDFLPKANGSFRPQNEFPIRRMEQKNFHEYMQAKHCEKDWKKAVIMFRDNSGLSWSCIFYNLSRELGRKLQVSQMFDDRIIIWCQSETEVENFLEIGNWIIPGTGDVKVSFKRWSAEEQNRDIKVECRDSWIGVKGLPLNLWNMKAMRKIGALCGGLIDVEKDTAEMNFLHHLRIKLEGDSKGFVPELLNLELEKSVIKLELFKLNDLGYKFSGYFNTCWHQDFEIGKMIEEEEEVTGLTKSKGDPGVREIGIPEAIEEEERIQESGNEAPVGWRRSGCEEATEVLTEEETQVKHREVEQPWALEVVSVPEKMVFSGTLEAAVEVVQPRALRPIKSLSSFADGAAAENVYCHFCINSREGMASNLCVREQGKVARLHTVFDRLLRSLRVPRVYRNPSSKVFLIPDNSCQIVDYGLSKMGRRELGRIARVPVKLGLHNTGPLKHYPIHDGISGCEFFSGSGPVKQFNMRNLWYYRRGPFNITLDQNFGAQDLFIKRAKSLVISDHSEPRRELMVVAKKRNPVQIIKEFFDGILRAINPKTRENFKKAIIQFWEDFVMHKRKVSESVLHYKGEMEQEEESRPVVSRVYSRKRSFDHGCVSNSTEENYFLEFEEADKDPKEFEFLDLSSEDEESEGEGEESMPEEGEETDAIICSINELWREEAEVLQRQGLGEVKLDEFLNQRKKLDAEERRMKHKKAREEFKKMLEESTDITPSTRWSKLESLFENDERFKAVERDRDRRELLESHIEELLKKEREKAMEQRKRHIMEYRQFLESCDFIKVNSQWRKLQDRLEADERCSCLEKIDRLDVFQEYIRDLEKEEEEQRKIQKEELRKAERKNRDEFRKMMEDHVVDGTLTIKTHWRDYFMKVKDLPAYVAVSSNTSGSTAKDLFEDSLEELQKQYHDDRTRIKDAVKSGKIILSSTSTFDDFKHMITGEISSLPVSDFNLRFVFDELLERVREKEDKEAKKRKRCMEDFSDLLSSTKDITALSGWEDCKQLFENSQEYSSIGDENLCQQIFEKHVTQLKERAKEREQAKVKEQKRKEEKTRKEKERNEGERSKFKHRRDKEEHLEKDVSDNENFDAEGHLNKDNKRSGKDSSRKHRKRHHNYDDGADENENDQLKKSHGSSSSHKKSRRHTSASESDQESRSRRHRRDHRHSSRRSGDLEDGEFGDGREDS
ncbi:hypothetical protein F8388_018283 [Cannabis sativa]|uniref:FF domain-containing protein n=1 Tax=Cannabis sativa TaxID=3483 RepID=A0A7J6EL10_CANSA|nr:hypothetical protein F8388_018283 [Cannabis sativa]